MILDKSGRIFGKVSIIDIIITVLVLGVVAGIGYKFTKARISGPSDKLSIIIYMEEVPDYAVKSVKTGDIVVDFDTNSVLGNVAKVETGPSVCFATDSNGEYKKSSKPGYSSSYITIDGNGVYRDGVTGSGVSIDNTDFYIGKSKTFNVGNSTMYGRIFDIKKVD